MKSADDGAVVELPPYRALLVVDIKEFGGRPGRDHARLTESIPEILQSTFRRCGLAELWDDVRFHTTTGDGYALGFRAAVLPFLLNPFLAALQEELSYRNRVCTDSGQGRPIRMRVSINVGPMTDSGENRISDGSGDARVETHRLLDCEPVRELLTRSTDTTCVAAVVSSRAFEDAVLSRFSGEDPNLYVPAPVEVKNYQGQAYLRVPKPSGDLLTHGFRPEWPSDVIPETSLEEGQAAAHVNNARDVAGSVVQARDYSVRRRGGVGNINGSVGNVVTDPRGPVNIGSGHQFNAPQFVGDGTNYTAGNNVGDINQQFGKVRRARSAEDDA